MSIADLPPEHRERLEALMKNHRFAEGEVLIRAGEAPAGLLVVLTGTLAVRAGEEVEIDLARVGPGEWVGEVALLDPGPASASVVALTTGTLKILSSEALARFGQQDPKGARLLTRLLSRSLAARLRSVTGKVLSYQGERPTLTEAPQARGWLSRLFAAVGGQDPR